MTDLALCKGCSTLFVFTGTHLEVQGVKDILGDSPKCPKCSSSIDIKVASIGAYEGFTVVNTSPELFMRASKGYEELQGGEVDFDTIASMLILRRIAAVTGSTVGSPPKAMIKTIQFDGGLTLNFASSSFGACVYQVSKSDSAAESVLKELSDEASG